MDHSYQQIVSDILLINYYLFYILFLFLSLLAVSFKKKKKLESIDKVNIIAGIINFFLIALISPFSLLNGATLSKENHLGFFLHFPQSHYLIPIEILSFLLLFDFIFYFYHRYLHDRKHLGRIFHQIHHNKKKTSWSFALRLHFLDFMLFQILKFGVAYLLGISIFTAIFCDLFLLFLIFYQHQDGPEKQSLLGIASPFFHHQHHLTVGGDNAKNFGLIFIFWDKLFKTTSNSQEGVISIQATEVLGNKVFVSELFKLSFGPFKELYYYIKYNLQNNSHNRDKKV